MMRKVWGWLRKQAGPILWLAALLTVILLGIFGNTMGTEHRAMQAALRGVVAIYQEDELIGSGLIISPDGYILTCAHVAEVPTLRAAFYRTLHPEAPLRLLYSFSDMDLAVMKIDTVKRLPVVSWGDARQLQPGDTVYTIGHPFKLPWTVLRSAFSGRRYTDTGLLLLQANACMQPGNSGGPLLDGSYRVIGISSRYLNFMDIPLGPGLAIDGNLAQALAASVMRLDRILRAGLKQPERSGIKLPGGA